MNKLARKWKIFKRSIRFFIQRRTRGWDDSVTWSLDHHIAECILPKLQRFRKLTIAYPPELSFQEWREILDRMIATFEFLSSDERYENDDAAKWKEVNEGLDLFRKYYLHLWW